MSTRAAVNRRGITAVSESVVEAELHPDAVARHSAIVERQLSILYAGAAQAGKRGTLDTGTPS